ncbi:vWA domain-containing protein [Aneurinibacillus thermoaerophilus]|uniref:vWA domain-containing protein n=1 Tax=Aneurinibacillus thermoaerophilus TaxID=143495 RepID=UPI002E214042|nr:VWA domain-containing protein [Aneurinibacillus thermoaerophilus]
MEKVLNDSTFHELRETTKLDELASALGTMRMGEKLEIIMQNQLKKAQEEAERGAEAERQAQEIEQMLENPQTELTKEQRKEMLKEMKDLLKQANKYYKQASAQVKKDMKGHAGKLLADALSTTLKETQEDVQNVQSMVSGLGYGTGKGELQKMPLQERIALGEILRSQPKVKKVAEIAGRMKSIARKKQKSKSKQSVGMAGVTFGNNIERLLPSELLLYRNPATKTEFLKRFGEGKVMQFAPNHKESLGKGPIVVCIDSSGSMRSMDVQSKGIMIALLSIAKKQKRSFAVINFASEHQCKVWKFPKADPKGKDLVAIIQHFFDGGTDFERPLREAVNIMEGNVFKEGDIVFITDGDARVSSAFLNNIRAKQKQKQFQIISIQLGGKSENTLRSFSNEVIKANSLFDERVTDKVFSI